MLESHSSVFALMREFADRLAGQPGPLPRRVLIVDGDAATRRVVDRVLCEAGVETALAEDGVQALTVARAFCPFELVVTDLHPPRMSGDELARRLRHCEPRLKVLYLSSDPEAVSRRRPCLWEDEAYLARPCTPAGLLRAVSLLADGPMSPALASARPGRTIAESHVPVVPT